MLPQISRLKICTHQKVVLGVGYPEEVGPGRRFLVILDLLQKCVVGHWALVFAFWPAGH